MKKIYLKNGHTSKRSKPVNLKTEDEKLFVHEFQKYINNSYYVIKKNLYIKNYDIYKFKYFLSDFENTKMSKYSRTIMIKKIIKELLQQKPLQNSEDIQTGIWCLDEKSFHYFHWFCDSLARYVEIIEKKESRPLLISSQLYDIEFVRDSLKMLNIDYIVYENNKLHKVNNLMISSHIAESGNFSNKNINKLSKMLKDAVVADEMSDPKRNIWVSRNKSKHRKIFNEEKLLNLLNRYNFEIIYPEDISFSEQLKIYKNTNILGGLHGGGLTNILFMNEGTNLIEIRRKGDDANNCYFTLASELKINYYYLESNSLGDDLYISNVEINEKELERVLSEATG